MEIINSWRESMSIVSVLLFWFLSQWQISKSVQERICKRVERENEDSEPSSHLWYHCLSNVGVDQQAKHRDPTQQVRTQENSDQQVGPPGPGAWGSTKTLHGSVRGEIPVHDEWVEQTK